MSVAEPFTPNYYGQIDTSATNDCVDSTSSSVSQCSHFAPVLYGLYAIDTYIMLINLLIEVNIITEYLCRQFRLSATVHRCRYSTTFPKWSVLFCRRSGLISGIFWGEFPPPESVNPQKKRNKE